MAVKQIRRRITCGGCNMRRMEYRGGRCRLCADLVDAITGAMNDILEENLDKMNAPKVMQPTREQMLESRVNSLEARLRQVERNIKNMNRIRSR